MTGVYDIYCEDCGRHIGKAPAMTWTYCQGCKRYTRVEREYEDVAAREYMKAIARTNKN